MERLDSGDQGPMSDCSAIEEEEEVQFKIFQFNTIVFFSNFNFVIEKVCSFVYFWQNLRVIQGCWELIL